MELRPFQKKALSILKNPGHLIGVAPTGSGKSLIFQRKAKESQNRSLLFVPLTALARQHSQNLAQLGVTHRVGGSVPPSVARDPKGSGLWILSPENLLPPHGQRLMTILRAWSPNFLIVDECHCLWEWGYRFRPAFQRIPSLISSLGIARSLWLTATLPPGARSELRNQLPEPRYELGIFKLPSSLSFQKEKVPLPDRASALLNFVSRQNHSGIVFAWTREACERITLLLRSIGVPVYAYHAGLGKEERENLEGMIRKKIPHTIVATSAFGMGMDFSHLQWVVLWKPPSSLLSLAQAIGRVGRAGRIGFAICYWDEQDLRSWEWIVRGPREKNDLMDVYRFLNDSQCPKSNLEDYFNRCHP